jgi:hypothetical protein
VLVDQRNRKSDNVVVATINFLDESGGIALDSVGSGFVHRLSGGEVVQQFVFRNVVEPDTRFRNVGDDVRSANERDTSKDAVCATRQGSQHSSSVASSDRFPQNLSFYTDYRVRPQNDIPFGWMDRESFLCRDSLDVDLSGFVLVSSFVDSRWADDVFDSGSEEEFVAARRGGG